YNDTSGLPGLSANRDCSESAAGVATLFDEHVRAGEDGRDQLSGQRLFVLFLLQQMREFAGTLAMSDQHDAASMVVVPQIVFPRVDDVAVGHRLVAGASPGDRLAQLRNRHLPVQRREKPALRREARELQLDDAAFL